MKYGHVVFDICKWTVRQTNRQTKNRKIDNTSHPYQENSEGKERKSIYIAPFILRIVSKRSDMDHSFTCKLHHARLSFVSVHQIVPPLTEVADIQLQLTTHLSTPKG